MNLPGVIRLKSVPWFQCVFPVWKVQFKYSHTYMRTENKTIKYLPCRDQRHRRARADRACLKREVDHFYWIKWEEWEWWQLHQEPALQVPNNLTPLMLVISLTTGTSTLVSYFTIFFSFSLSVVLKTGDSVMAVISVKYNRPFAIKAAIINAAHVPNFTGIRWWVWWEGLLLIFSTWNSSPCEAVVLVLQLGVQFRSRKINHFILYCLSYSCTTCPIYHSHDGFVLHSILLLHLGVIYVPPFFHDFYMNTISVLSSKSSGEMQKRDWLRLHRCFALEELLQDWQ